MSTFSVLTVTKRTGWFKLAERSIAKQTVLPVEWIIVAEPSAETDLPTKFYDGWRLTTDSAPEKTKPSNLNASLNKGLRFIETDYVIFYQDFIQLKEDCFEKLLALADGRTFVTTCTPNYDGTDDGRYTGVGLPRPCRPEEWEANVSLAPMALIRELGGFDEDYDWGWSWDNVNLAQRAAMLGARFILDESNRPKLLPHEQEDKEKLVPNGSFHEVNMRKIREGKKPIKLDYLQ